MHDTAETMNTGGANDQKMKSESKDMTNKITNQDSTKIKRNKKQD